MVCSSLLRSISQLRGHTDRINEVSPSPVSPYTIFSASLDQTVRVWDLRSGKAENQWRCPKRTLSVSQSYDGRTIGAGYKNNVVLFDARNGARVSLAPQEFKLAVMEFLN